MERCPGWSNICLCHDDDGADDDDDCPFNIVVFSTLFNIVNV